MERTRSRGDDRNDSRSSRDRGDDRGGRERTSSRDDRGGRDRGGREEPRERETSRASREVSGRSSGRQLTYNRRTAEDVDQRIRESSSDKFDRYIQGAEPFTPHDKENCIRVLPATWEGAKHWGLDLWVHYSVGPDEQTYLCLEKMQNEKCPVCEEMRLVRRDGDQEGAKQLEPKRRVLVYLIDRDDEKKGLQVWAMPQGLDSDITRICRDKRSGETLFPDDPDDGYDIMFEKTGSKKNTKYEAPMLARKSSDLGNVKWWEDAADKPLPTLLQFYDYEHIAAALNGGGAHTSSRDRDRDDDRGRDRDRGGRDEPRERSRGGRDDPPDSRNSDPEYTWDSVHGMTSQELDDLCATHPDLEGIKPEEAQTDEELADWICEDLGLTDQPAPPPPPTSGRTRTRQAEPEPDTASRLSGMRTRVRS